MEAKICPDGSAVGRTGPNCEFAECPTASGLRCKENDKYFVIADGYNSVSGLSNILVKYKREEDQKIDCNYVVESTDFEIKDQWATSLLALTDNFLVLDIGTAPVPRVFDIYDLSNRKKVYSDHYSTPTNIKNDLITYWSPINEKVTNENCPDLDKYSEGGLGAGIEAHVTLDLSNLVKKDLGEHRCSARQ
jgi:hypothetical protein